MPSNFEFQPRLSTASTIPADWYYDPEQLELEKRRVFSSAWQLAGRSDQVSEPGEYFTTTIGIEPAIVVRNIEGELLAISNVCRHRAGPVAEGAGKRKSFQCGYHGWTYKLDGSLSGMPEFDGVECFGKDQNNLPRFSVGEWNGLVFVNPDPECITLGEYLTDLSSILADRDLSKMTFAERKDWHIDCNWKVYVDNYLEGYHIPIVHPSLFSEIDYDRYNTEISRFHSIQRSPLRIDRLERLRVTEDSDNEALYIWLFPNLMLNVYPDNYSTNLIVPLSANRTLTIFEWYFQDAQLPDVQKRLRETVAFSDEIQIEDINICEAVQRGLESSTYSAGRYSVKREGGVHHFHGLLSEYLSKA